MTMPSERPRKAKGATPKRRGKVKGAAEAVQIERAGVDDADAETESLSARACAAKTVENRIRLIRDVMLADEWTPKLIPTLASAWSHHEASVRKLSAEASRRIRDADNKPLVRARLLDRLDRALGQTDEAFNTAKDADEGSRSAEVMVKATESATRAILATAQIAGVSVADKGGPSLTINVGEAARSSVLSELWSPGPKVIDVQPTPNAMEARQLPGGVHDAAAVPADESGGDQGVAKDSAQGAQNWRIALGGG